MSSSQLLPIAAATSAVANPADDLPSEYNAASHFLDGALAHGWGERTAIRAPDGVWTYARLAADTNRAGNALRALGVEMEQRVAMLLFDSPQFAATLRKNFSPPQSSRYVIGSLQAESEPKAVLST